MALAEATCLYLANTLKAYTLFSTHYFELTQLATAHPRILNYHLEASFSNDKLVFLYQLQAGPTARSYGLEVAALAGLPLPVLDLARARLLALSSLQTLPAPAVIYDTPFDHVDSDLKLMLNNLELDALSARDALAFLYDLKEKMN